MHAATAGIDWQIVADVTGVLLFALFGFVGASMFNDLKSLRETAVTRGELAKALRDIESDRKEDARQTREDRRDMHQQNQELLGGIRRDVHDLKELVREEIAAVHEKVNQTNVNVARITGRTG